ncbi:family 16 glycoside hydrolase [Candidatus Chloroploca asiatica]|uniref:3-keto-alpha-glucoside-1,2-lyase/3-keto-2-hydroxy-glucal hydratase domain-containing protein n=1 Tax=Candidatus Chloroploca asiatica TaxID=1506545 RepID=A0A2H3KW58_9CHLR|nr:family 16 glycoside hydrolase [Candidatus Chloroploca asiatica]PDV98151.1 hypothetical protein A9Q02_03465 [Candidatus Chloroploca asiatica]
MKQWRIPTVIGAFVIAILGSALAFVLWQVPQGVAQEQQPMLTYPPQDPTPTVGPNPTVMPALASVILAEATFDTPEALDAWEVVDLEFVLADNRANWQVSDGRLVQNRAGLAFSPSIHQTAALIGDETWRDYTVQVSFYDQLNGTAGLIARYQGDDPLTATYYRYRIIKNSFRDTPRQVLERVERGVAVPLAEVQQVGFEERMWHVLSMQVVGNAIEVRMNGEVMLQAVDANPLPAGKAGIATRAVGTILFDDVVVVTP